MALTPMDIHHKEFKSSRFGGYNEEDVDSFLDLVADEFERLIQESNDLRQQSEHYRKRLSEFEEMQTSLQSALLAASKSAEAVKEQARQESETVLIKAQEESDAMMRNAQEQARQMLLAAQNDKQKIERAISKLEDVKRKYIESVRQLADTQLKQVNEWESRNESEGMALEAPPIEPAAPMPPPALPRMEPETATPPEKAPPVPEPEIKAPEPAVRVEPSIPPVAAPVEPHAQRPLPQEPPPPASAPRIEAPLPPRQAGPGPQARTSAEAPEPPAAAETTTARPQSANLVDEVLAMDDADETIFGDFPDDENPEGRERGRKGRKDKKEKHFFWE